MPQKFETEAAKNKLSEEYLTGYRTDKTATLMLT